MDGTCIHTNCFHVSHINFKKSRHLRKSNISRSISSSNYWGTRGWSCRNAGRVVPEMPHGRVRKPNPSIVLTRFGLQRPSADSEMLVGTCELVYSTMLVQCPLLYGLEFNVQMFLLKKGYLTMFILSLAKELCYLLFASRLHELSFC